MILTYEALPSKHIGLSLSPSVYIVCCRVSCAAATYLQRTKR